MATLAKPYGGQAATAWPESPASINECKNLYRSGGIRSINRAHSLADLLEYKKVTADAVFRTGDILTESSSAVLRTTASTPVGSETVTLSGNGGEIPYFVWAGGNFTAPSSVTQANVGAVYDINLVELAMRIYHATRASAIASSLNFAVRPSVTTTYYEYGIAEQGTDSKNYFPVLDLANQDGTNGSFAPWSLHEDFGVSSIYGMVWCRATGVA